MRVTDTTRFDCKKRVLSLLTRTGRSLTTRPALLLLFFTVVSWLLPACKTFSQKENLRVVLLDLKRENCDWIGAEMKVTTTADSGRMSFEVRRSGEGWTELTSVSGKLTGTLRRKHSEPIQATHRSEWLFNDTAADYRACFESNGQPKVCSEPRSISGCNLFIPEPEVRFNGDSLEVLFADRWIQQPVYLRLNDGNGSILLNDTIANNPTGRYAGRMYGRRTGKARLTMTWKNHILIRDIQNDLTAR